MDEIKIEKDADSLQIGDVLLTYCGDGNKHLTFMKLTAKHRNYFDFEIIYSLHSGEHHNPAKPFTVISEVGLNIFSPTTFLRGNNVVYSTLWGITEFSYSESPTHLFTPHGQKSDPKKCCWKLTDDEIKRHIYMEFI